MSKSIFADDGINLQDHIREYGTTGKGINVPFSDLIDLRMPSPFNLDLYLKNKTVLSNYCTQLLVQDKHNTLPRKVAAKLQDSKRNLFYTMRYNKNSIWCRPAFQSKNPTK